MPDDELKQLIDDYLDDSYDFLLEVTREQYNLIIYALELASRLESGQLKDLIRFGGPVRGLTQSNIKGILDPEIDVLEPIIERLKNKIGLLSDESIGIRQSTERAKQLYEMYYEMKHRDDPGKYSVYKFKLDRVTNKPLIKIRKIKPSDRKTK